MKRITAEQAIRVGKKLRVNFMKIDPSEFINGINDEHGEHSSLIGRSLRAAGLVVLAHLREDKHYYSKIYKALGERFHRYKVVA